MDQKMQGWKFALIGPSGTGKTFSLGTIADAGKELFVLFTENGAETLAGYWADRGLPVPDNVHWHTILRRTSPVMALRETANKINTLTYETLAKIPDSKRAQHNQYIEVLESHHDFPDDRTGQKFGDFTDWGTDRVLVI